MSVGRHRLLWLSIIFSVVGGLFFVTARLFPIASVQSADLTSVSLSVASNTPSVTTSLTTTFKTATTIPASGRVRFLISGVSGSSSESGVFDFSNYQVSSSSSPNTFSASGTDTYSFASGAIVTTSQSIAAGTTITIILTNVKTPARPGYYSGRVWTTNAGGTDIDGSSNWSGTFSPYFEIGNTTNFVGTVTDASGNPAPFVYVSILANGWLNYVTATTDVNGRYGAYIAPGTYTLNLAVPFNYVRNTNLVAPTDVSVTIPSSGTLTQNLKFIALTKTLTGKITLDTTTGAAITDAVVYINKSTGNSSISVNTDSNGNYSATLSGGTWNVSYYPKTYPGTWVTKSYNQTVTFADDASVESATLNLIGLAVDASFVATVQKPDGTIPSAGTVGLSLTSASSQYFSGTFDAAGKISVPVTQGTYSISLWSSDSNFSPPSLGNVTVAKGETKNLGAITLVAKNDSIVGSVKDDSGAAIAGAYVSGWKNDGTNDWASATTASDGSYTLKVTAGTWQVSAWPPANSTTVSDGKPDSIIVASGVKATKNFTFQKASNTLTGTLTNPDGSALTNLSVWVSASDGSQPWGNIGASVVNGAFTLHLPKGKWTISAYLPSGDYSSPDPQTITFDGDNQSQTITLKAQKNNAAISGTVYDNAGNKVTNKFISIWATKGQYGSWQQATFNQGDGTYSVKVSAGTWHVSWYIDPSTGYSSETGQDYEISIGVGETKSYDIKLKKADSIITGKTTKEDGSTFAGVWVTADTRDPSTKTSTNMSYYTNGASSTGDGQYSLRLPAGTYYVGGNMWNGSGYMNPKLQKVTIDGDHPGKVDLVFNKPTATISGTVKNDGQGTSAYVTAYSSDGAYAETNAGNIGNYSLPASDGLWHVQAIKKDGKSVYHSKEVVVNVAKGDTKIVDVDLSKQNFSLPDAQTITFDPTLQQTITLGDGTTLNIPANVVATSGRVTLTTTPNATLANQAEVKPLAYGYDFKLTDQNGKAITNFPNGNITIESKYDESWLSEANVQEGELNTAYYDTAAGKWIELNQCTANTNTNTITCQVNHFTTFALVVAVDTTPPSAPTTIVATPTASNITLTWTNPSEADFATTTIYRSTESGTPGDKLISGVKGTSYNDQKSLVSATTYYYTIKATDVSGNESINTDQVSAKSIATASNILPKTGQASSSRIPEIIAGLFVLFILGWRIQKHHALFG